MAGALKTWDGSQWVTIGGNADQTTHTGEVTGDTALTVNPGGTVTVATGDLVLVQDVSDSNSLQRVTAQSIADLGGGGGGSGQSLNITSAANTRFDLPTNNSRRWAATTGPWQATGIATQALDAGTYCLGLSIVRGGLYEEVSIDVTTAGSSGDTLYYVMYNVGTDGMPTTQAYSFGPFAIGTSTGAVEVTGISTTVTTGVYWCGIFAPNTNSGSPVCRGGRSGWIIGNGSTSSTQMREHLVSNSNATATPSADLSAFTLGSSGAAGRFGAAPNGFPHLACKELV